jgi:tetratricopeptide (TPR) repeat protein
MTKKIIVSILAFTLVFSYLKAQTYKQQFNELFSKKDTAAQRQLLEKWQKTDANDPELFVAYYNYYVVKGKKEMITIGQNPKGENVFQILDQDTSKKEPVAYMYGDVYYEPDLLSKGFDWINKGIEKFPNRLDMRFGKTYIFGQIGDYESFTKEIIKAIDYSVINSNQWVWSENKTVDDPKKKMLQTIQSYQIQLYNTGNDSLLNNMKRIAESVLKYYPDHIESLSNLSIVFMLQKNYDDALIALIKAEKLNSKDFIVLSNIAQAYKLKGDSAKAIEYYELVRVHGDEEAKQYATEQIKELKKK